MKRILFCLLVSVSGATARGEAPSLRDSMRTMGYILDEIHARSNDVRNYGEAAAKARALRTELVRSIAFEPAKFQTMTERQKNAARIEYHQLLARVIYLSATLEKTLDAVSDDETQSGTRLEDVRNLLHEINVLVGKAHAKFRD